MGNPEHGQGRKWRCAACGAIYMDHQLDGTEYYHACGPVRRSTSHTPDVADRLAQQLADVDEAEKRATINANQAAAGRDAATDQAARAFEYIAIEGHRDENVDTVDATGHATIRAEGAGRLPL